MGRRPTLLVVEDAEDHALLTGFAARRAHPGLTVHGAANGLEAVAYLAGLPPYDDRSRYPMPDLVLLDLYMPELNGFEVLEWIRDRPEPLRVPIVVLTGSIDPEDEARARHLGAIAVYRKPGELQELSAVVREIVESWIGSSAIIGAHLWAAG